MKTRIEELWDDELRNAITRPVEKDSFRLTRIHPTTTFDIYAGIDDSLLVVLAIGINSRPPAISLESASLDYFRKQRADGSWLMVLRLNRRGLEQVFGRLCQDLVDAAAGVSTESGLVSLFKERLNLWKRLFQLSGDGLLQTHEIKGLIAELLILEYIVASGARNITEAVGGWVGPLQADQDFIYGDLAIEVKAISLGKPFIMISSLEQLDCALPLSLVVVSLCEATSGEASALTLNALVARIEEKVASSSAALDILKNRLLEARYIEHDLYDHDWYRPTDLVCYEVRPSFPKLIRNSVPSEVESVTYSLVLSTLNQYKSEVLPE